MSDIALSGDAESVLVFLKGLRGEIVKAEDVDTPRVLKALESDELAYGRIVKAEDERRFTLGLAYPALRPDVAVAKDGHIDYASIEALEKAAWSWMSKSRS